MAEIPKGYHKLEGSERHPAKNAKLLGPADAKETVRVTVLVRRRPDGPPMPGPEYFLKPPTERRRMPEAEFAAKYGASEDDLAKVAAFADTHSLRVVETNAARRAVILSGTVSQMSRAFGVSLGRYEHSVVRRRGEEPRTETYRGRDGAIHIPADLVGIVEGVFGLDNRNITKRNSADPPNTVPLSTTQIAQLYDFPTNSAAGQTIGIVSVGGYLASDISATFGGSPPTVTDVSVDGVTNGGFPDGETTQDICIAGLAAPGAAIAVYFQNGSQAGWVDLFHKVAHPMGADPHVSVISSSFYICDGDDAGTLANEGISAAFVSAVSAAFQDAAIQGVTVCIASGDTGSSSKVGGNPAAWGYPFPADGKAHVQFPGSSPWVLAVGGTTIGNVIGLTFDEYVWNDPAPADPSNWGTTGGGVSDFFALPSYQIGAGVPTSVNDGHTGRGVPDVAGNASINAGYSGLVVGGGPFIGNGTSASSPLWAGLIAVINAAIGANVGFANPTFYALGSSAFRDIVPGAGPVDNSNSGITGYPAGPGWDACTGWGSPNGKRLLAGLTHQSILATAIVKGGNFGDVCVGSFQDELLTINNTGFGLLSITNITSSSPEFETPDVAAYPLLVSSGGSIEVVVRFAPASPGFKAATLTISSNDPASPHVIHVKGDAPTPRLDLAIAGTGDFGNACLGSFVDKPLVLTNSGKCMLLIPSITSSSSQFLVPEVLSYPLSIGPGDSLELPIRFEPTSFGPKAATLTVNSNDPIGSHTISVRGEAPAPRLTLILPDTGNFGHCCVGSFVDEPLILTNSGKCTLSIRSITSSSAEFLVPGVLSYPVTIGPGDALPVPVRFAPTSFGPKAGTISVVSDDPAGTRTIGVSGDAPSGKLAVTGSTCFGGVKACRCVEKTISICNVGDCKLHVKSVAFKRKSHHWKLINNPFPATLHPGSCLCVVIRYKAMEKCPRCCELVIVSDDPHTPVKTLDLMAYTVWNDCSCKRCCDDCKKGCCNKNHGECCCEEEYDCCCDEEEEGEEEHP
jgi:kumamolisin